MCANTSTPCIRNMFFKLNKIPVLVIKLIITVGLLYWLYSYADSDSIKRSLILVGSTQVIVATSLHVGVFLLGGVRWWLLLRHTGVSVPFRKILPSYYLGVFSNNFLPTSMGGDVIRVIHLKLRGLSAKALVGSAMVDRIIGLTAVVVMGTASVVLSPDIRLGANSKIFMLIFTAAVFAILWFLLTPAFIGLIEKLAQRYRHTRIRKALLEIIAICYSYRSTKKLIFAAFGVALVMQGLAIWIYYYLGASIGIELSPMTYYAIIPIVFLATNIPLSIGGLGIREGALVALLVSVNIDTQLAITLSLLFLFVLWLSSVPGAAVMAFGAGKSLSQSDPHR
jgi:uncharacterized protein (TIRG00374 family)